LKSNWFGSFTVKPYGAVELMDHSFEDPLIKDYLKIPYKKNLKMNLYNLKDLAMTRARSKRLKDQNYSRLLMLLAI